MKLFVAELKKLTRGILYLIYFIAIILFFMTQFYPELQDSSLLIKPQPGVESYGTTLVDDPNIIMPNAVEKLLLGYIQENFATYPLGFYKNVRVSESEIAELGEIIQRITGENPEALIEKYIAWQSEHLIDTEYGTILDPNTSPAEVFSNAIDYDSFKQEMQRVDDILGGGSDFAPEQLLRFGKAPRSYDDALAEYETIIYEDKISGAFARLFCDYMGIAVGFFAVFVSVGFSLRDRRSRAEEVIFSRSISSAKLVLMRYFASLFALMLPVLLLALIPTIQLGVYANANGLPYNWFAFIAHALYWIGPIVMVCCSVGFFFTILTASPIGIAVQLVWTVINLFVGSNMLSGEKITTQLIPRHNTVGSRELMDYSGLFVNRIGYAIFALLLVLISIAIYEWRRRGKINVKLIKAKKHD